MTRKELLRFGDILITRNYNKYIYVSINGDPYFVRAGGYYISGPDRYLDDNLTITINRDPGLTVEYIYRPEPKYRITKMSHLEYINEHPYNFCLALSTAVNVDKIFKERNNFINLDYYV